MAPIMMTGPSSRPLLIAFCLALSAGCSRDESTRICCTYVRHWAGSSCFTPKLTLSMHKHHWETLPVGSEPERELLADMTGTAVRVALRCLEHAPETTPPRPPQTDADMPRYLGELEALIETDLWRDVACDDARELLRANCLDAVEGLGRVEAWLRAGAATPRLPPFASRSWAISRMCTGDAGSYAVGQLGVAYSEAALWFGDTIHEGERKRLLDQAIDYIVRMRAVTEATRKHADAL